MNRLRAALAGAVHLFFDDRRLACAIVVLLAAVALSVGTATLHGWTAIALLVGGTIALLLANVVETARRFDRRR